MSSLLSYHERSSDPNVREEIWTDNEVALLTGGQDVSYVYGLTTVLAKGGVRVHVVGTPRVDHPDFHTSDRVTFVNLGGIRQNDGSAAKAIQLIAYYLRLLAYITLRSPQVIHILWNGKLEYFDRTALTCYLKILGKRVVFTAHNVNKARRDSCDSALNRLTLTIQYRMMDQIFVHREKMKSELVQEFGVPAERVSVIPFGLNIMVPDSKLTTTQAKQRLGLRADERTVLFYGRIVPYKGLDCLVEAFRKLAPRDGSVRLIIAGEPMKGSEKYVESIRRAITNDESAGRILCRLEFIPDNETEVYFKAADVLALPYMNIFESGVLYLAYRFGLPVIASDVGSFGEELADGRAGFVFESGNSTALADAMAAFFDSDFYRDALQHRARIQAYGRSRHSWQTVGQIAEHVYSGLTM